MTAYKTADHGPDAGGAVFPGPSHDVQRDAAMARSYPPARMVDGGACAETAAQLHAWAAAGLDWIEGGRLRARYARARAAEVLAQGSDGAAAAWLVDAAACFRFAQAAQDSDSGDKLADYLDHSQAFAEAMALTDAQAQQLVLPTQLGAQKPWLFLPRGQAQAGVPAPYVLVFGGADGWCEALYPTVPALLACGLAVCLLELPGQGLTRLQSRRYLTPAFPGFVSGLLDVLAARTEGEAAFGICGHSLGGSFAVVAAAADARFLACCANSGSARPGRGFAAFPRVLGRVAAMTGGAPADAVPFLDALDIPGCASRMQAALLCLHGERDTLFDRAGVEELVQLRGTAHARLRSWADGEHCLYSHRAQRNTFIAEWFAQELRAPATAGR